MRRRLLTVLIAVVALGFVAGAQTKKPTTQRKTTRTPAPKPPATKSGPVEMKCPNVLGTGVSSRRTFCDVLIGTDPAQGIVIPIPPRTGKATLTFDLHARHTYSEAQTNAGSAYARYAATVVLANLKSEVLGRASVLAEFRTAKDLFDRVSGGAGPAGVKAVAPVGQETVVFEVPEDVTEVVVLGEKLTVQRLDGREVFSSAGRPIAILSNPTLEYKPKPPPRRTTRRR